MLSDSDSALHPHHISGLDKTKIDRLSATRHFCDFSFVVFHWFLDSSNLSFTPSIFYLLSLLLGNSLRYLMLFIHSFIPSIIHIQVNAPLAEVEKWVDDRVGQTIQAGPASGVLHHFIVEPFLPHKPEEEYYICIHSHRWVRSIVFDLTTAQAASGILHLPTFLSAS